MDGTQGLLGRMGEQFGKTTVKAPLCAACLYGKQERNPKKGTTPIKKHKEGILKQNKLEPGELVFTDQYESRQPGRVFNARGHTLSSDKYCGGTLFCDAATGKMAINHQVGLTSMETIGGKLKFEREAAGVGVTVKSYSSDNGIYTSKEFMKELAEKGQGI